jgi:hypothetical protein
MTMTLDEFKTMAEAWGADIGRWPQHLRAAAAGLADRPDAAAVLAEAEAIDRFIIAGKPDVSRDRIDRAVFGVVAAIAGAPERRTSPTLRALRRWLIPAASFASAAVLGVSLGLVRPLNMPHSSSEGAALTMILGTGAFGPDWVLR